MFPSSIRADAATWAEAADHARVEPQPTDRRQRAAIALKLLSFDPHTISKLLADVSLDAQSGQVTLGWRRGRRRGAIAKATHYHGQLLQYLCAAAAPHLRGKSCTTAVISNAAPTAPPRCAVPRVYAVSTPQGNGRRAHCEWSSQPPQGVPQEAIVVSFYAIPVVTAAEAKEAATLHRKGVPVWNAQG